MFFLWRRSFTAAAKREVWSTMWVAGFNWSSGKLNACCPAATMLCGPSIRIFLSLQTQISKCIDEFKKNSQLCENPQLPRFHDKTTLQRSFPKRTAWHTLEPDAVMMAHLGASPRHVGEFLGVARVTLGTMMDHLSPWPNQWHQGCFRSLVRARVLSQRSFFTTFSFSSFEGAKFIRATSFQPWCLYGSLQTWCTGSSQISTCSAQSVKKICILHRRDESFGRSQHSDCPAPASLVEAAPPCAAQSDADRQLGPMSQEQAGSDHFDLALVMHHRHIIPTGYLRSEASWAHPWARAFMVLSLSVLINWASSAAFWHQSIHLLLQKLALLLPLWLSRFARQSQRFRVKGSHQIVTLRHDQQPRNNLRFDVNQQRVPLVQRLSNERPTRWSPEQTRQTDERCSFHQSSTKQQRHADSATLRFHVYCVSALCPSARLFTLEPDNGLCAHMDVTSYNVTNATTQSSSVRVCTRAVLRGWPNTNKNNSHKWNIENGQFFVRK